MTKNFAEPSKNHKNGLSFFMEIIIKLRKEKETQFKSSSTEIPNISEHYLTFFFKIGKVFELNTEIILLFTVTISLKIKKKRVTKSRNVIKAV